MSVKPSNPMGQLKPQLFYIGVKALIRNEDEKILLLQADVTNHSNPTDVYWDIPGGRINEGEEIQTALSREIIEETGIGNASVGSFFAAALSHHKIPYAEGRTAGLMLMVYEVTVPPGVQPRLSEEHTAYEWVDEEVARQRLSHKYPNEFIALLAPDTSN